MEFILTTASYIGIVYQPSESGMRIHVPCGDLKELKALKASNGSIVIDEVLEKPFGECISAYEFVGEDKGVIVGLSLDGSFRILQEGIKPGAEIRLGKESPGHVFVQAEIAK